MGRRKQGEEGLKVGRSRFPSVARPHSPRTAMDGIPHRSLALWLRVCFTSGFGCLHFGQLESQHGTMLHWSQVWGQRRRCPTEQKGFGEGSVVLDNSNRDESLPVPRTSPCPSPSLAALCNPPPSQWRDCGSHFPMTSVEVTGHRFRGRRRTVFLLPPCGPWCWDLMTVETKKVCVDI